MLLANREFNHDVDSFHESMNISDATRTRCRERIFFNAMSNAIQRDNLFEDREDAPREMTTVSGDLQRCLRMITDQLEYEYTLMIFNSFQRMAMETYAMYRHMMESENSKEDRIKMKIMDLIDTIRSSQKDEDDEDEDDDAPIDQINKQTMLKRVSFVKKSHHNFDTYMNILTRWADGESDSTSNSTKKPDIDDLLRNLFSKDED